MVRELLNLKVKVEVSGILTTAAIFLLSKSACLRRTRNRRSGAI